MRLAPILAAALLAGAACSDSTAPVIALTDEEIAQLFVEMTSAAGDVMGAGNRAPNGMAAATTNAVTVTATLDCIGGGTVGLSGSVTESPNTVSADITESFNACRTETFTIGGALRLIGSLNTSNDSTFSVHETVKGVLTLTHEDGRSGTCAVDVVVDLSVNGQNFTASASGTICGRNASVVASTMTG